MADQGGKQAIPDVSKDGDPESCYVCQCNKREQESVRREIKGRGFDVRFYKANI